MQINYKLDDLVASFVGAPQEMDAMFRAHLQSMVNVDGAQQRALEIERTRVMAKYGAASSQAALVAARLESLKREQAALQDDLARMSASVPAPKSDTAAVYGRVLSSDRQPQRGVKVGAVAPDNTELDSSSTNDVGAFQLDLSAGKTPSATYQLQVTNRRTGSVFTHPETFMLQPNTVTYRDITVPGATPTTPVPKKGTTKVDPKRPTKKRG